MKNELQLFRIIAIISSAALILFIIATMGDRCSLSPDSLARCGHRATNWLLDFQGLLGGVLAVMAAAITVFTMNKNTKEILYANWQHTVYKAIYSHSLIEARVKFTKNDIENYVFNDHEPEQNADFVEKIVAQLKNMKAIYEDIERENIFFYSRGMLRTEYSHIIERVTLLEAAAHRLVTPSFEPYYQLQVVKREIHTTYQLLEMVEKHGLISLQDFVATANRVNPFGLQF